MTANELQEDVFQMLKSVSNMSDEHLRRIAALIILYLSREILARAEG